MMKNSFILVQGPTGVGKSDTITEIGKSLPIEIINCDMGQFYEPCAIGTAKPDWKNETVTHHLFDIIKNPENLTVSHYRNLILEKMKEVWSRNKTPVLVGGSGFYGKSLFFPPKDSIQSNVSYNNKKDWDSLFLIDPVRAQEIDKNDAYRIERAFELIQQGNIPSQLRPEYNPPADTFLIIFLNRDRQKLYQRINARTQQMLKEGWIEEVQKLQNTEWQTFLEQKKLIGYPEIFTYLKDTNAPDAFSIMQRTIQKKTRNYAKRQITFWKMFKKLMSKEDQQDNLVEINLSDSYAADLLNAKLNKFILA